MSIQVDLSELAQVLERFNYAYLTTTDAEGRPHVVAVSPVVQQGHLVIADVGRKSSANAAARPRATLVWPPADRADHTLIVDVTCSPVESTVVRAVPIRAVLHRPAPPSPVSTQGCGSDCVEVAL